MSIHITRLANEKTFPVHIFLVFTHSVTPTTTSDALTYVYIWLLVETLTLRVVIAHGKTRTIAWRMYNFPDNWTPPNNGPASRALRWHVPVIIVGVTIIISTTSNLVKVQGITGDSHTVHNASDLRKQKIHRGICYKIVYDLLSKKKYCAIVQTFLYKNQSGLRKS